VLLAAFINGLTSNSGDQDTARHGLRVGFRAAVAVTDAPPLESAVRNWLVDLEDALASLANP